MNEQEDRDLQEIQARLDKLARWYGERLVTIACKRYLKDPG